MIIEKNNIHEGTPPPVQGKPPKKLSCVQFTGDAGKTQFEPLFHLLPKEHPRPYGENHIDKLSDAVKEGTSLLVRGIHLFILVTSYTPGITPTHTWNPLRIRDYHACTIASLNHLWILSFFGSDAVSRFSVYSGRIFLDRLSRFHDDVLYP